MTTLGAKIRELREEKDLSLRELARKLRVSAAYWSDVELGRRQPSDEKLEAVATILDIPLGELRRYDTRPPVEEVRRLSREDPAFGLAFRRVIDEGVSAEELMRMLGERNQGNKKKK